MIINLITFHAFSYGDVTPRSVIGRTLGICWMLIGVILGSVITATVTDSLTSTIDFDIINGHKVCFIHVQKIVCNPLNDVNTL